MLKLISKGMVVGLLLTSMATPTWAQERHKPTRQKPMKVGQREGVCNTGFTLALFENQSWCVQCKPGFGYTKYQGEDWCVKGGASSGGDGTPKPQPAVKAKSLPGSSPTNCSPPPRESLYKSVPIIIREQNLQCAGLKSLCVITSDGALEANCGGSDVYILTNVVKNIGPITVRRK